MSIIPLVHLILCIRKRFPIQITAKQEFNSLTFPVFLINLSAVGITVRLLSSWLDAKIQSKETFTNDATLRSGPFSRKTRSVMVTAFWIFQDSRISVNQFFYEISDLNDNSTI